MEESHRLRWADFIEMNQIVHMHELVNICSCEPNQHICVEDLTFHGASANHSLDSGNLLCWLSRLLSSGLLFQLRLFVFYSLLLWLFLASIRLCGPLAVKGLSLLLRSVVSYLLGLLNNYSFFHHSGGTSDITPDFFGVLYDDGHDFFEHLTWLLELRSIL